MKKNEPKKIDRYLEFGERVVIIRGFYKDSVGKIIKRRPASPEDNYDVRLRLDDEYYIAKEQAVSDLELMEN